MINIMDMLNDLNNYKEDRSIFMSKCIENRLKKSIESYSHDVTGILNMLAKKDCLRVLRAMSRIS